MSNEASMFVTLDLPVLAAGALAGASCALVGCFLTLRRMSLMGDAISHAVLPGLVAAFLISGSNHTLPMLAGAVVVGVMTTALTELAHRMSRVEEGASMGVVFTTLFAIGVIMLERTAGGNVHIDADCVLYGQMESIMWLNAPGSWGAVADAASWEFFPRQVVTLGVALGLTLLFVILFFKELTITSFDPALATALGIRSGLMRYMLTTLTAIVAVAAFEAVGSILVVAMLIVPAMVARLLTDRLSHLLAISVVVAVAAAAAGYAAGAFGGRIFGSDASLSAAGMTGVALGVGLAMAGLFAPRHGAVSRVWRRARMRKSTRMDDALAALYRAVERAGGGGAAVGVGALGGGEERARRAALALVRRGDAALRGGQIAFTDSGAKRARRLVRAHRLWETYLVDRAGLRPDHVHDVAERLEHVTDTAVERHLAEGVRDAGADPHGRPIPQGPDAG